MYICETESPTLHAALLLIYNTLRFVTLCCNNDLLRSLIYIVAMKKMFMIFKIKIIWM